MGLIIMWCEVLAVIHIKQVLPSLNTEHGFTVWTAANINEDVKDENELTYNEFYKDYAGCKPTYILYEWMKYVDPQGNGRG